MNTISIIIIILCCVLFIISIVLIFVILFESINDTTISIKCFFRKRKIKRTPEYKEKMIEKELNISKFLDKYSIKDIETISNFEMIDEKIISIVHGYTSDEIKKYLRKKKIQKLK